MASDKNLIYYAMRQHERNDFFHSSTYANAQNKGGIGVASGESFRVRQSLEKRRQHIQNYRKSKIGNSYYDGREAKTYSYTEDMDNMSSRRNDSNSAHNPMDIAVQRARFNSSGNGRAMAAGSDVARRAQPLLSQARAPQIPNRRSGI